MSGLTPIDYSAFSEPLDPARVRQYKSDAQASGQPWARFSFSSGFGAALIGLIVVAFVFWQLIRLGGRGDGQGSTSIFTQIIPIVVLGGAVLWVTGSIFTTRHNWQRWYRLDQFARRNGLHAMPRSTGPSYPGTIFNQGENGGCTDRVMKLTGRYFEISNYSYTTGSGKNKQRHEWGYLALRLDRRLPQMVLDATANNGLFGGTNLPARFTSDQVLKLEGDFNRYFRLYCPQEYERDALYIFTPDLMALLIDDAQTFDVEIVADWMFVYSVVPFNAQDPSMWKRMLGIVRTVGAKTIDQSENYRDERVVPAGTPAIEAFAASNNEIAPPGRRLRTRGNWVPLVAIFSVAIIAWIVLSAIR